MGEPQMYLPRRRAPGRRSSLRGRLALLVLLVVLAGSPWVQRPLSDYYAEKYYIELSDNKILRWLVEAAFLPRWEVSAERYGGTSSLVVNDLAVLVLLAALVFFARRLSARGAAGGSAASPRACWRRRWPTWRGGACTRPSSTTWCSHRPTPW